MQQREIRVSGIRIAERENVSGDPAGWPAAVSSRLRLWGKLDKTLLGCYNVINIERVTQVMRLRKYSQL